MIASDQNLVLEKILNEINLIKSTIEEKRNFLQNKFQESISVQENLQAICYQNKDQIDSLLQSLDLYDSKINNLQKEYKNFVILNFENKTKITQSIIDLDTKIDGLKLKEGIEFNILNDIHFKHLHSKVSQLEIITKDRILNLENILKDNQINKNEIYQWINSFKNSIIELNAEKDKFKSRFNHLDNYQIKNLENKINKFENKISSMDNHLAFLYVIVVFLSAALIFQFVFG